MSQHTTMACKLMLQNELCNMILMSFWGHGRGQQRLQMLASEPEPVKG